MNTLSKAIEILTQDKPDIQTNLSPTEYGPSVPSNTPSHFRVIVDIEFDMT
jgi:hypothetical protein